MSRLTPVVGPVLVSRLQGRAKWEGRFVARPGLDKLEVRSNLNGVDVLLPDPLWKPKRTESALDVQVDFDRDSRRIAMDFQDRLRGELHYERKNDKQVLVRGVLNLGSDRGLPEDRLSVAVKGEHIDMDRWIEEIDTLSRRADKADSSEPERDALFDHLRSLDVDVDRFRYLNRNLGPVEIHATTDGNRRWAARFVGPRLRGTGRMWLGRTPKRFDFNLTRLHWPRLQNIERATTYEQSPEPSEFAHLSIRADDFRYGEMRFGRLDFQGGPAEHAWRIKRMSLQQPAMRIDAKGRWSSDRFGAHRTRVDVSIDSNHLGKSLAQLGLKDQVAKGKAEMTADLSWPGGVGEFDLAKLNGELSFTAEDGRFLKLQPGSGRLLGLFNAESLTRRLKLDFTDIFNDGLAFDRIDGDAAITTGRLRTDGIFIIGPAALIELSGSTSLAEETYDLNVAVAPQLGGNLSLAGAIVNPAAGAMIFLVQKLFKKQMANLINHKYRVTGDWDAPRVKAVEHPATDATEQLGRN
ncbi:MAG: hypothetical protein MAG794_01573 [Gammaproteobacteria bacterium]|nr:hypothetical protein [Gammaproteobacteria bacterium]